jgi:hypothetical protein
MIAREVCGRFLIYILGRPVGRALGGEEIATGIGSQQMTSFVPPHACLRREEWRCT